VEKLNVAVTLPAVDDDILAVTGVPAAKVDPKSRFNLSVEASSVAKVPLSTPKELFGLVTVVFVCAKA
jgi:hypothetical protein